MRTSTKQARNLKRGDVVKVSETMTRTVDYVWTYYPEHTPEAACPSMGSFALTEIHFVAGTVLVVPSHTIFR